MKRLEILCIFLLMSVASFSQDTLKSNKNIADKKFGISIGFSVNTYYYGFSVFSRMNNAGVNPIIDYREKIFLNSFQDAFISPFIEFNYFSKKKIAYSISLGYDHRKLNTDYALIYSSHREFQNVFANYQANYFFKWKITKNIIPFIGAGLYYGNKMLSDVRTSVYNRSNIYKINEK